MWIYDDLCNGEYHTCHIFFPPIEISWCNFEVKFLKKKKNPESFSLVCSDGHLDSGFLPLYMSMETLKNHLLTKFKKICMEHQKPANDPIQNRSFQESLRRFTFRSGSGYIKDL